MGKACSWQLEQRAELLAPGSVCVKSSRCGNYFKPPEEVWLLLGRAELHQLLLNLR